MADPELRKDMELVANVTAHIQEHIDFLRTTDPDLLMMIGEQPLNPPMAQGNPGMPQGMDNQQVLQGSNNSQVMGDKNMNPQPAAEPGMPEMPTPPAPFEGLPIDPSQM